jgi:hypothetical protein
VPAPVLPGRGALRGGTPDALPNRVPPPTASAAQGAGPSTATPSPSGDASAELTSAAQRWLDAYYRRDPINATLPATREAKISDERAPADRLQPGLNNVRRTLDRLTFQFVGESAILTALMKEQATVAGEPKQYSAWISQIWLRESGQWRLMQVRMISDAALKG